jgi:hypothetical protein
MEDLRFETLPTDRLGQFWNADVDHFSVSAEARAMFSRFCRRAHCLRRSQIALGQEINDLKRFFGYDALLIGGRTARALRDGRWR